MIEVRTFIRNNQNLFGTIKTTGKGVTKNKLIAEINNKLR